MTLWRPGVQVPHGALTKSLGIGGSYFGKVRQFRVWGGRGSKQGAKRICSCPAVLRLSSWQVLLVGPTLFV